MQRNANLILIAIFLLLSCVCSIDAANFQVRGYLSHKLYYTPERLLDGGVTAYLVPEINIATPVKAYVQLGELYAGSSIYTPTSRAINFTMRRAFVTLRDPIFPNWDKNFLISIGDVSVNYSSYTLRLDGSTGNPRKKGVTISFPTSNDFALESCFLWDLTDPSPQYSYIWGSKLRKKMYGIELEGIYVSADEWQRSEDPATKVWEYQKLKTQDAVWSLNGKKRVSPNLEFDVLVANNRKLLVNEEVDSAAANLIQVKLSGLGGLNLDLSGWNFDSNFEPKHRDHYRFWNLAEDGYGNLVDRYQGKIGFGFNIFGGAGNVRISNLGYEHYVKSKDEIGDKSFVQLTLTHNKYSYSGGYSFETRNYVNVHGIENEKTFRKRNFGVSRNINFAGLKLNANVFWDHSKDNIAVSPTRGLYVKKQGLSIDTTLPKGIMRGTNIDLTVQKREYQDEVKLDLLWKITYTSPRGLRFIWRGASPNDIWDAGKHLDYVDNLIQISHVVYF